SRVFRRPARGRLHAQTAMWPCANPGWLSLGWDGKGELVVHWGVAGEVSSAAARIESAVWLPIWRAYRAASRAVAAYPYTTFVGGLPRQGAGTGEEGTAVVSHVLAVHECLYAACRRVYDLLVDTLPSVPWTRPLVVLRSRSLATMPLARIVAV